MESINPSLSLYDQVVTVTYEYLGPAADRFITRQIRNHLNKAPEQLSIQDLPQLIAWIRLTMAFLYDNEQIVAKYVARLQQLAKGVKHAPAPKSHGG